MIAWPTIRSAERRELGALIDLVMRLAPARPKASIAGTGFSTPVPEILVRRHRLAPLAYRAGQTAFRQDFLDSALLAELREQLTAEALAALATRSIPAILLKGVSYAATLYRDPAERPMGDIDLMVPPEGHSDAVRALRDLGYRLHGRRARRSSVQHALSLRRANSAIDLHRSIVQPWRSQIDVPGLWRRARPAAERTDGALRLNPVDEATVHMVHMARHECLVPLINYVDAVRLLDHGTGIEVGAVLERAAQFRLHRAVRAALATTAALVSLDSKSARIGLRPCLVPGPFEIARGRLAPRPVQLARKALLVEGPLELFGLFAIAACERLGIGRKKEPESV